jgi:hypothetical protein
MTDQIMMQSLEISPFLASIDINLYIEGLSKDEKPEAKEFTLDSKLVSELKKIEALRDGSFGALGGSFHRMQTLNYQDGIENTGGAGGEEFDCKVLSV